MAGEVLNMSNITLNKHWFKLKDLYFKSRHKTIYSPLGAIMSLKATISDSNESIKYKKKLL